MTFLSYHHPAERFFIYLTPQYQYQLNEISFATDFERYNYLGGISGVGYQVADLRFLLEGGYFQHLLPTGADEQSRGNIVHVGLGLSYFFN